MKIYDIASGSLQTFVVNLNSLSSQGYSLAGGLVAFSDGSLEGNPLLLQLVVKDTEEQNA